MDRHGVIGSLFGVPRALIGVIHVGALPGTPRGGAPVADLIAAAVDEARIYREAGFHGLILENMHDRPYLRREVGPEVVATMAVVTAGVRAAVDLPLGVQILAGANQAALGVALAAGATFVRVEGFVFGHLADEGLFDADAGELLRYRQAIGAGAVRVFADIKKKHSSHAVTADVDLADTARAAEFFLADGVIVTGSSTGRATDPADVTSTAAAVGIPTLVGSGVTADNVRDYRAADALIVGSSVKVGGVWSGVLDPARAAAVALAFGA